MVKKLVLKKLTILATTEKLGNQFTFGKGINLITSSKNSVGKSTLIKSILSSFGTEAFYDKKWKDLQCNYLIDFSIEEMKSIFKNQFSKIENAFYKIAIATLLLGITISFFPTLYGDSYHGIKEIIAHPNTAFTITFFMFLCLFRDSAEHHCCE